MRAAIEAVDAGRLVARALADGDLVRRLEAAGAVDVIAAGKAASAMLNAWAANSPVPVRSMIGIGQSRPPSIPPSAVWHVGTHPVPDGASEAAGRRALECAAASGSGDVVLLLLSGGASSLMAVPAAGVSLEDKRQTVRRLLASAADINDLNTVRKHLSAIKGGRLATATRASVVTLALSDVVGDDLAVIGSGPGVADPTTFAMALEVLDRRGGRAAYPEAVVRRLVSGASGDVEETPKPGDARLAQSSACVIGGRLGAVQGARAAAASLGYEVIVIDEPVVGDARAAGPALIESAWQAMTALSAPYSDRLCILASGETTVQVTGTGTGGRNQECALAMAPFLTRLGEAVVAASVGTDGVDGPTDAAGAVVDTTTLARAASAGMAPEDYLDDNNTYAFFAKLGDSIHTGPTGTNVGDLHVILINR